MVPLSDVPASLFLPGDYYPGEEEPHVGRICNPSNPRTDCKSVLPFLSCQGPLQAILENTSETRTPRAFQAGITLPAKPTSAPRMPPPRIASIRMGNRAN